MIHQNSVNLHSAAVSEEFLNPETLHFPEAEQTDRVHFEQVTPTWFYTRFEDCMEMYADLDTVAEYLDHHQGWFCRCAEPMQTQPIGENAYDILIGRFGAFGYQVEARIGLELLPPDEQGIYRIRSVPVPGYTSPGYEVKFEAEMKLVELPVDEFCRQHRIKPDQRPTVITGADWTLDLYVGVKFPKFINSMSKSLIQKTGDRLLAQIVKQVSRRLSYKTQMDFHTTENIPFLTQGKRKKGTN
ncbi:MAG: DUF1997 domain-containing protein [Cyanobacteriota bacterium]|nr:DUF1997 domain-containing protein [Cyanobacteriota bacterium]